MMDIDPEAFSQAKIAYVAASPVTHFASVEGLQAAIIAYLEEMDRNVPIVMPDNDP